MQREKVTMVIVRVPTSKPPLTLSFDLTLCIPWHISAQPSSYTTSLIKLNIVCPFSAVAKYAKVKLKIGNILGCIQCCRSDILLMQGDFLTFVLSLCTPKFCSRKFPHPLEQILRVYGELQEVERKGQFHCTNSSLLCG